VPEPEASAETQESRNLFKGAGLDHDTVAALGNQTPSTIPGDVVFQKKEDTTEKVAAQSPAPRPKPKKRTTGAVLGHYKIQSRLGSGGMGDVYLAIDLVLNRRVALKIAANLDQKLQHRWIREAWASARLQHPFIATFYDAGEVEDTTYMAMEYVEGETLRDRLTRGPMPVQEVIRMADCLLQALAHAHAADLLHRDIKPENIMLTKDGGAKLLDFGIAKPIAPEIESHFADEPTEALEPVSHLQNTPTSNLTMPGALIGTPGYMAPEQATGGKLDVRSDLFSLATVLHEAVTGVPLFARATPILSIIAPIREEAPPLSKDRSPAWFATAVGKALSKDPNARFSSAEEFRLAVRGPSGTVTGLQLGNSIAVLEFTDESAEQGHAWLGVGLVESLSGSLKSIRGLNVVLRERLNAARAAAGSSTKDLGAILACRWLVTGSFARSGDQLRVSAKMIDTSNAQVVFESHVRGAAKDIFQIEHDIAVGLSNKLELDLPEAELPAGTKAELEAYECYARARQALLTTQKTGFQEAARLLKRAVELNPKYAAALSGLAQMSVLQFTFTTDPSALNEGVSYAKAAVKADPNHSDARVWLAYGLFRQGDGLGALPHIEQAMELDRQNALPPYFAGTILTAFTADQALTLRAQERPGPDDDPDVLTWCRKRALWCFRRAIDLNPALVWAWVGLGWIHLELASYKEASVALTHAIELEPRAVPPLAGVALYLGECLRRMGKLDDARQRFMSGLAAIEKSDHMYRDTFRGVALTGLGRTALQQGDKSGAQAAFKQATLHIQGRSRALGGGHILCQAMAGLCRAGEGAQHLAEALELYEKRSSYDFSWFWGAWDEITLLELARGAYVAGDLNLSKALLERARSAGASEAFDPSRTTSRG
jgi:serine/threonine protein kinase/tetratricopeptide (TPR) repeat protein